MSVIKAVGTSDAFLKQPAVIIIVDNQKFKSAFSGVDILTSDADDKYGYIKISSIHNHTNIQHDTTVKKLISTAVENPESAG